MRRTQLVFDQVFQKSYLNIIVFASQRRHESLFLDVYELNVVLQVVRVEVWNVLTIPHPILPVDLALEVCGCV